VTDDDLVRQLRDFERHLTRFQQTLGAEIVRDAADRIEELQAENERLKQEREWAAAHAADVVEERIEWRRRCRAAEEDAARLAAELNSYCGHDEQAASPRQAIELHRARLAQTNDD